MKNPSMARAARTKGRVGLAKQSKDALRRFLVEHTEKIDNVIALGK